MNDELKICQCGREIGFRAHCPQCGSMKCYPLLRKMDTVTRPDGNTVDLRVWRCTRCSHRFNDDDWQLRCKAAPEQFGRKKRPQPAQFSSDPREVPAVLKDPAVDAVIRRFYKDLARKQVEEIDETKQEKEQ